MEHFPADNVRHCDYPQMSAESPVNIYIQEVIR